MPGIADDARVVVFIADFANDGGAGKLNALGVGFVMTTIQPQTGLTAPMSVVALIDVLPKYVGTTVEIGLELIDAESNSSVLTPGPSGKPDAIRIVAPQLIAPAVYPPGISPPLKMITRLQLMINFANGLPLTQGRLYEWRVKLDGYHRKGWTAAFFVPAAAQLPLYGGQGGPADIPTVTNPAELDDDLESPPEE